MAVNVDSPKIKARFWSRVQPAADDKCWPWMREVVGGLKYGRMSVRDGDKVVGFRANRLAFYYATGRWPRFACHRCDNALCCNPSHIYDGTPLSNMRDMIRKGRKKTFPGEKHGMAKLTDTAVLSIRAEYAQGAKQEALAAKYKCCRPLVSLIVNRRNWKHLP